MWILFCNFFCSTLSISLIIGSSLFGTFPLFPCSRPNLPNQRCLRRHRRELKINRAFFSAIRAIMSRIWWKKSPAQITLFCPRAVAFSSSSVAAAGGENESARSEIMAGRDRSSLNGLDIFCFNPHCDARYQGRISLVVFPCSLQQPVSPLSFANNLTPTFNESVNVRQTRCTAQPPIA